jgi:hypothetical protein
MMHLTETLIEAFTGEQYQEPKAETAPEVFSSPSGGSVQFVNTPPMQVNQQVGQGVVMTEGERHPLAEQVIHGGPEGQVSVQILPPGALDAGKHAQHGAGQGGPEMRSVQVPGEPAGSTTQVPADSPVSTVATPETQAKAAREANANAENFPSGDAPKTKAETKNKQGK